MGRLRDVLEPLSRLGRRPTGPASLPGIGSGGVPGAPSGPQHDAPQDGVAADVAGHETGGAGFKDRARLRRRLRYLRQTRELGFRDLGGFIFDSKRFGRDRDDIVRAKLEALTAIDRELRALEIALSDAQDVTLLHEPGISVCPRCGALHGSEDNYCPGCALPVGRGLGLAIAQGGPGGAVSPAAQAPAGRAAAPSKATAPPADPNATAERQTAADQQAEAVPEDQPTTEHPSVAKQ